MTPLANKCTLLETGIRVGVYVLGERWPEDFPHLYCPGDKDKKPKQTQPWVSSSLSEDG